MSHDSKFKLKKVYHAIPVFILMANLFSIYVEATSHRTTNKVIQNVIFVKFLLSFWRYPILFGVGAVVSCLFFFC